MATETEAAQGLREECKSLRTQIDSERDAAEQKYAELERSCADEKETALAVERSLRDHYEKLNGEWQRFVTCLRILLTNVVLNAFLITDK